MARSTTEDQPDVYVYAEQRLPKDEAKDALDQQHQQQEQPEQPVETPPQDVAAEETSSEDDDKDPKKLLAKANELFQRSSHRLSSQNDAMEKEARALVAKALELDPHALDVREQEESKPMEEHTQRERLTVPVA